MERHALLQELQTYTKYQEQSKLEKSESGQFFMHLDIKVEAAQLQALEDFLLTRPKIVSFSL